MLKRDHDPALDVFDRGCFVLRRDGQVAGYVATTLGPFWSPGRPFTMQDRVWLIVVWADGERGDPIEDYPPWSVVSEVRSGIFVHEEAGPRQGEYVVDWLLADQSEAQWAALGVTLEDF